jgi:hypothetical protein
MRSASTSASAWRQPLERASAAKHAHRRQHPGRRRLLRSLLAAHEGLGDDASNDLNARLVLLLANQIGDQKVLLDCIAEAKRVTAGTPEG